MCVNWVLMTQQSQTNSLGVIYEREHFVQFYHQDEALMDNLLSFIGAGIKAGDTCVIICTKPHRLELMKRLKTSGINIEKAKKDNSFLCLDAADTLAQFMVGGVPRKDLFQATVGSVLSELSKSGKPIRAFGEMVALLYDKGNMDAAVRLERLWNEIASEHSFTLFCAYPMHYFDRCNQAEHSQAHIGHLHTTVVA